MQAGDRDGQTCFDIGACTSIPTFQTRPYHTRPPTISERNTSRRFHRSSDMINFLSR
ncbi:hypothetical protein GCK32_005862 [Trichostrongylus colubriformis]|uniref:Uncharacterized protein n=1 Tax=Trichostrongylus colubriformis TaxID=6319 RepID=A0AAN8IGG0_TRICO